MATLIRRTPQLWQRMGSPALTAVSWLQSPHTYFTSARFSSSPTVGAAAGVVDAEEAYTARVGVSKTSQSPVWQSNMRGHST